MASRRLLCGVLVAGLACVAWAEDKTNELEDDSSESSCDHDPANAVLFPFVSVWKSKFHGAFVLDHRVVLHAIDATPARWRGDAGSSPLDRARFVFLALGAATLWIQSRYAPDVPYTVLMLVEGFLIDYWASVNDSCPLNAMQQALYLWSHIDGDTVLLIFLPAFTQCINQIVAAQPPDSLIDLRTGLTLRRRYVTKCAPVPAGRLAMSVARRAWRGVFGTLDRFFHDRGVTLWLPVFSGDDPGGDPRNRSCGNQISSRRFSNHGLHAIDATPSSIASTDPVAIVGVLKSAGASEILTIQIKGESLFNDGASMVLMNFFFRMYRGHPMSGDELIPYLAKQLIASPLIGALSGIICVVTLAMATRRFGEEDSIIQTMMTICAAYLSYFMAEQANGSGVLAVVVAGIIVAARAWPLLVAPEALEHTWEAIEHIANTLIFALAGVLTRKAAFGKYIRGRDYAYSIVFYILVVGARAVMMLVFYPVLSKIDGMKKREAVFVVWGGLHGAVGLALALNVQADLRKRGSGGDKRGDILMFHVAVVSFLTMVINATTARYLLQAMGLVKATAARLRLRDRARQSIEARAAAAHKKGLMAADRNAEDATQHVTALRRARDADASRRALSGDLEDEDPTAPVGFDLGQAESFVEAFRGADVDEEEVAMIREVFYRVLKLEYRHMVETGELPRHSMAPLHLSRAADVGLDNTHKPIYDYEALRNRPLGSGTKFDAVWNQPSRRWRGDDDSAVSEKRHDNLVYAQVRQEYRRRLQVPGRVPLQRLHA